MGKLLVIPVIIACLSAGSIILIAIKRLRKIGLSGLRTLLLILMISGIYLYIPRYYDRNYLKNYSEWKELNPKPAFLEIDKTLKQEFERKNLR